MSNAAHATPGRWNLDPATTLLRLLADNAAMVGDQVAIREKDHGIWQQLTWRQFHDEVLACAAALQDLGLRPGEPLVVMGDNRPHLYIGMVAAGAIGALATPVFPDATPDELLPIVTATAARMVLAEDQEQVDKALELQRRGARLEHILYDNPRGLGQYPAAPERPALSSWQDLVARGRQALQTDPDRARRLIAAGSPDDPAALIHSSGTTGRPKGVLLTQRQLLAGVRNARQAGGFDFGEDILAYLPMAWIGDFAITVGAGIALRFTINIPEGQETVLRDLREIAPTFYLAAPRSWDNLLTTVQVRMADSTPLKRRLYDFFMALALAAERRKLAGEAPTPLQRGLRPLGEWLVAGPIKDQLGLSRLRHAFTGGEAIGEDSFLFYRALGVRLRQLYGQTETAAFNAMHAPDEVRLHTVGRPMPGVTIRISDDGEILIQSGSVFEHYHGNEQATAESKVDGWLRTGDAGYLEADGQVVVLGRLSDVVHTATGERYIPNYIENRLKFSPWVKDVAVLGKDREWLAAIVCIDREAVGHWAELNGIAHISYADLSQKPAVIGLVREAVQHVNATLPEPLRLRRFVSLHKEFDADDGEITRTRKLRRTVVESRYAPIIDALYDGSNAVTMRAQIIYETGAAGTTERELAVTDV